MSETFAGDRLAKVIARAGLCSRRDAEDWIRDGRVSVNGKAIRTPAFNVTAKDRISVDGNPLSARQGTRVWLYHKPAGLVVTEKDPEGRPTIFDTLESHGLPRVVSIGRLDINTEGLLLLTNDGGLKRVLELPATGWLRRYRVRAFGEITQPQLDRLKDGIEIGGVNYGPIEAVLERQQGSNVWLVVSLREGKNREVKNVLAELGLKVNRLIRVSFGPFQLGELPIGAVEVVRARVLREQLGKRLADEAGVDFDSDLPEPAAIKLARNAANPKLRAAAPGKEPPKQRRRDGDFRFADRTDQKRDPRPPRRDYEERPAAPRRVFREDGSETEFTPKLYGKRPKPEDQRDVGSRPSSPAKRGRGTGEAGGGGGRSRDFAKAPRKDFEGRPKRDFGSRGSSPAQRRSGTAAEGGGGGGRTRDASKVQRKDFGDRPKRPYAPRAGDRPDRPKRAHSEGIDRPRRSFSDKPRGSRPTGDKPFAKRPRGSGPNGDRPRRPKPPRA
ncbi:MAG TPA: pseudouridine synthase [Devosia sp.]|nr:pseudouridine synthase [Devosia sp.]